MNFVLCVFTMFMMRFLEPSSPAGTLGSTRQAIGFGKGHPWGHQGVRVAWARSPPTGGYSTQGVCRPLTPPIPSVYLRLTSGADANFVTEPVASLPVLSLLLEERLAFVCLCDCNE